MKIPVKDYPTNRLWDEKVFSMPNIPRGSIGMLAVLRDILEPCVDKKDTRQKQRYKILNIEDMKTFQADKREKSLIFQNARPFQKFYAPEMQKHPCNGRSKIALTQKRPQGSQ